MNHKTSQFLLSMLIHALTVGEGRARSAAKSAVLCPTKSGPVSGIARGPVYNVMSIHVYSMALN